MSGIDVDLSVLDTIAQGLDTGVSGLEGLSGSVPSGVDAGPMTAVIASMLSQVVDSAGNVSVALSGAADNVRLARRYYQLATALGQAADRANDARRDASGSWPETLTGSPASCGGAKT